MTRDRRPRNLLFKLGSAALWTLGLLLSGSPVVNAGMSSENVVVVVNGDSPVSRTVANHYIEYRQIPTTNVVVLSGIPTEERVELDTFRDKVLRPVLAELDARGISTMVRVIAYSADIPTAIRITEHTKKLEDATLKKYQTPWGSSNGLTYFYRFLAADSPAYLSFSSNLYARGRFERYFANPFKGEPKEQFDTATGLFEEGKFAESAELWKTLASEQPSFCGIAIRAAESFAEAGDDDQAIAMIQTAVQSGWRSESYLGQSESLAGYLDDARLKEYLPVLDDSPIQWQGPVGFSSTNGWAPTGDRMPIPSGGIPYLCSCSLAVVSPNGSSLSQATRILKRASRSDRTFPKGRFAFGTSGDVRAKTRFPGIADAIVYLQENDFDTEVYTGVLPSKPGAVSGLMVGSSSANFASREWMFNRGAIADNLTSFGGVFHNGSQVKLTEFLAAGAAMSSGTVTEPYSLQAKFPTPMLYAYYARGLSAIESFYQTVTSPYQLLIVGDPLAQPFAKSPDELVDVKLVDDGRRKLRITRRKIGLTVPKSETAAVQISIDERLFRVTPPVPAIEINWPENTSGVYDVRVTLIGSDRTEPRVSFVSQIDVGGEHPAPVATLTRSRGASPGFGDDGTNSKPIQVELSCPGADRITLQHLGEAVASVNADSGTVTVETDKLGGGPLRFRPVATFGEHQVRGLPIVDYEEPDK